MADQICSGVSPLQVLWMYVPLFGSMVMMVVDTCDLISCSVRLSKDMYGEQV